MIIDGRLRTHLSISAQELSLALRASTKLAEEYKSRQALSQWLFQFTSKKALQELRVNLYNQLPGFTGRDHRDALTEGTLVRLLSSRATKLDHTLPIVEQSNPPIDHARPAHTRPFAANPSDQQPGPSIDHVRPADTHPSAANPSSQQPGPSIDHVRPADTHPPAASPSDQRLAANRRPPQDFSEQADVHTSTTGPSNRSTATNQLPPQSNTSQVDRHSSASQLPSQSPATSSRLPVLPQKRPYVGAQASYTNKIARPLSFPSKLRLPSEPNLNVNNYNEERVNELFETFIDDETTTTAKKATSQSDTHRTQPQETHANITGDIDLTATSHSTAQTFVNTSSFTSPIQPALSSNNTPFGARRSSQHSLGLESLHNMSAEVAIIKSPIRSKSRLRHITIESVANIFADKPNDGTKALLKATLDTYTRRDVAASDSSLSMTRPSTLPVFGTASALGETQTSFQPSTGQQQPTSQNNTSSYSHTRSPDILHSPVCLDVVHCKGSSTNHE